MNSMPPTATHRRVDAADLAGKVHRSVGLMFLAIEGLQALCEHSEPAGWEFDALHQGMRALHDQTEELARVLNSAE